MAVMKMNDEIRKEIRLEMLNELHKACKRLPRVVYSQDDRAAITAALEGVHIHMVAIEMLDAEGEK